MSLNKVILTGRFVEDPVVKTVGEKETSLVETTLAVNRNYKNADGEREADFVLVQFWGGTADLVAEYCQKGRMIGVEGRLKIDRFESDRYFDEDDNPATIYRTYVVAEQVHLDVGGGRKETSEEAEEEEEPRAQDKNQQKRATGSRSAATSRTAGESRAARAASGSGGRTTQRAGRSAGSRRAASGGRPW